MNWATFLNLSMTLVLIGGLAGIVAADVRAWRIPDALSLPLVVLGLVSATIPGAAQESFLHAAIAAALGYGLFVAVETGYRRLRGHEGLGRGDAKLAAVAGTWCGPAGLPAVILGAAVAGLLFVLWRGRARAGEPLPFAPFLALAIVAVRLRLSL